MSLLKVEDISVYYGDIRALWGVSFSVEQGNTVALIGANGAGKTTTLKAICGLLQLSDGRIIYKNQNIANMPVHQVVEQGITLIPEGRQIFPKMTVEENLLVGSYLRRAKAKRSKNLARVYELFPRLAERRKQVAETLSGGEQQMLAVGRGLMQDPDLIMLDEPSLGLAPVIVHEVFSVIKELARTGLTVLLVEQNVHQTLKIADYCYVIERGKVVKGGHSKDLEEDSAVREAYLGF